MFFSDLDCNEFLILVLSSSNLLVETDVAGWKDWLFGLTRNGLKPAALDDGLVLCAD